MVIFPEKIVLNGRERENLEEKMVFFPEKMVIFPEKIVLNGRERKNLKEKTVSFPEKIVLYGRARENLKEKMVNFQRTKTKLRNNMSSKVLEAPVKFSILRPVITDNDIDEIVQHFCLYPGRAKARNISIYIHKPDGDSYDEK